MEGGRRRLGLAGYLIVGGLAALTLAPSLGGARRLTSHEAIVAQGAREMIESGGGWLIPMLGGRPWLEKPPLAHWMVAGVALVSGSLDETTARVPSAVGAVSLSLMIAWLGARIGGPRLGLVSGLVQATTFWTVQRGRLADCDLLLSVLLAGVLIAFEGQRSALWERGVTRGWYWLFHVFLGATCLVKGLGFGAVLGGAVVVVVLVWDRDVRGLARLSGPFGWVLTGVIALAWPLLVHRRHPEVLGLWWSHVAERLHLDGGGSLAPQRFASEPTWMFVLAPLTQLLPWTPLAAWGMVRALGRANGPRGRFGPDRLLLAWALVPLVLLSMASVKQEHYLIHALAPWSIWTGRGIRRLGTFLRVRRGWSASRLRRGATVLFCGVGVAYALVYGLLVAGQDDRGRESIWYSGLRPHVRAREPVVLLYDWDGPEPWDRLPYASSSGLVPPDLAVRLFYLNLPAGEVPAIVSSAGDPSTAVAPLARGRPSVVVVGRERDLPSLARLGKVTVLSRGPTHRWDRSYLLARIERADASSAEVEASRVSNEEGARFAR